MLYHLLYPLRDKFGGFNVFRYITFRSAGAVLTALIVSFVLAPSMIAWLRRLKVGQHVRDDGPQTHLTKQGTPTMGGLLIIAALVGIGPPVVGPHKQVRLGRALRHARLRRHRVLGRLPQGREEAVHGAPGLPEVRPPDHRIARDRRFPLS